MSDNGTVPPSWRAHADQRHAAATDVAENVAAGHLAVILATARNDPDQRNEVAHNLARAVFDLTPMDSFLVIQCLGNMVAQATIALNGGLEQLQERLDRGECYCGDRLGHSDHRMPVDPFTE